MCFLWRKLGERKDLRHEWYFLSSLKPSSLLSLPMSLWRVFLTIFPSGCFSALLLLCRLFLCWLPWLSIFQIISRPIGQAENCCFICLVSQLFRHLQFLSITHFYWNLLLWSASQNKDFTKKNNKLLANIICMVIALQCLLNQCFWHSSVVAEVQILIYYDKKIFSFFLFV